MVAPPAASPDSLSFKARYQPSTLISSAAVAVKQAVDVGLAAVDCMYGPLEAAVQKQQQQQQQADAAADADTNAAGRADSAAAELSAAAATVSAAVELNAAAGAASASPHQH
jgi:hypothetical protein